MMGFVDVAVPRPVWNTYTYLLPDGAKLPDNPFGIRVEVPFKNSHEKGWVISKREKLDEDIKDIKKVINVIDLFPPFSNRFQEFLNWASEYYFSPIGMLLKLALPTGVPPIEKKLKMPINPNYEEKPSVLMENTENRLKFYIEKISEELKTGRQVLLLFPEIQILRNNFERLKELFPADVVMWTAERSHRIWHDVRNSRKKLIVGTRRAIFSPALELGLIIVESEASENYWQERVPFYNAHSLAIKRASLQKCKVILGDRLPLVESVFKAAKKFYTFSKIRSLTKKTKKRIEVVDLRVEKRESVITERMVKELRKLVKEGKQAVVFVNRRGYASFIVCGECGFVPKCPNCSISLTYYRDIEKALKCKFCGYTEPLPDACPVCGGTNWFSYSAGVEQIAEILRKAVPEAKIRYMDSDLGRKGIRSIINDFKSKKIDILVSTSLMLSHLYKRSVNNIYIVQADMFMNISDFRAGERSYRLFDKLFEFLSPGGKLTIQTFDPSFPIIKFFSHQNRWRLYRYELANRKELSYPPFSYIMVVEIKGRDEEQVKKTAEEIAGELLKSEAESVLGPVKPALNRIRGVYRLRIILKDKSWTKLHSLIKLKYYDILLSKGKTKITVIVDPLMVD